MAELFLTPVASQIARTVNDVLGTCTASGLAVIAREGTNPQILGLLASSTANLVPKAGLIEGLKFSQVLEGTWKSGFMANFMGLQQGTMQQGLLGLPEGQILVLYVTALAAATTTTSIRGLLKGHIALTLELTQVGDIPESTYRTCVHAATLQSLQPGIADYLD